MPPMSWATSPAVGGNYGARNPLRIPGLVANHLAARSQERLFLTDVDEIWCTSKPDAARLAEISGNRRVIVVPNAISVSSISPSRLPDRPIVGFIGTYAYTPNLDAAIVLVDDVLPLLRVLAPDVRVRLAGTGMPAEIEQRLSLTPNVQVMGPVGDAAAFVAGCRVMALPIRRAAGCRSSSSRPWPRSDPSSAPTALVSGLEFPIDQALLIADSRANWPTPSISCSPTTSWRRVSPPPPAEPSSRTFPPRRSWLG